MPGQIDHLHADRPSQASTISVLNLLADGGGICWLIFHISGALLDSGAIQRARPAS